MEAPLAASGQRANPARLVPSKTRELARAAILRNRRGKRTNYQVRGRISPHAVHRGRCR
jgi:hypothetical protein